MSFGNSTKVGKIVAFAVLATVLAGGLLVSTQLKAASNCTGPSYDSTSKTLSLVCTESTDIHELSCSDSNKPARLSLTVNGSTETIDCPAEVAVVPVDPVVVVDPVAPLPAQWIQLQQQGGLGCAGSDINFRLVGHDDGGSAVRYGIDWDNNGTYDEWQPASGFVPSDTVIPVTRSWPASDITFSNGMGSKEVAVKLETESGLDAYAVGSVNFKETCIDLKVNDSDGPLQVFKNSPLNVTWVGDAAISNCTVSGTFQPSLTNVSVPGSLSSVAPSFMGGASYTIACSGASDTVFFNIENRAPSPPTITHPTGAAEVDENTTFTITGTDPDGDDIYHEIDWDNNGSVDMITSPVPSGTAQSAANSWSSSGSQTFQARTRDTSGAVSGWTSHTININIVGKPNFTEPLISQSASTGFDPATGMYNTVTITFQTSNNGESNTTNSANYRLEFDRYQDGYELSTSGSLGLLNAGQSVNRSETITNVPFGNSRVRVTVDSDDDVDEVSEGDNVNDLQLTLPPPNPNISINANRLLVKSGETVTLTWDTNVTYPMACRVFGPGITTYNFDPSVDGRTAGSPRTSAPLSAKSEYTISCTVAGTTFTDSITVETLGSIEEI